MTPEDEPAGARPAIRRRTAMLGAAGAAVAVALASVAGRPPFHSPAAAEMSPPFASPLDSPADVPMSAGGSMSAGPRASAVAWQQGRLVPATLAWAPGWLPAGLGPRRVDQLGSNVVLRHEDGRGDVLSLEVGPVPGGWEVEGEQDHRATVGRAMATVRTSATYDGARPGDRYVGVRWKLPDGQWAQLLSFGPRSEALVLRVARRLRPGSLPVSPSRIRLAEAPPSLRLSFSTAEYLCLTPPPVTRETMQQGLCVGVEPAPAEKPDGVPLTVGDRPAVFTGDSSLQVDLGNRQVLIVDADPETVPLSSDDLVRFAAGIQVAAR